MSWWGFKRKTHKHSTGRWAGRFSRGKWMNKHLEVDELIGFQEESEWVNILVVDELAGFQEESERIKILEVDELVGFKRKVNEWTF
jgi:hypothetical protein